MLNSTEHETWTAHKHENPENKYFLAFKLSDVVFVMLVNVKMPTNTNVGILTLMSMMNFMFSWVAQKSFITLGQGNLEIQKS